VRKALLDLRPNWPAELEDIDAMDLGDVFVVPQLLHDDMISPAQRTATANAIYPTVAADERAQLPVSPLSMLERALDLIRGLNPNAIPIVLGGDHSCAWPVTASLGRAMPPGSFGIVQPDAHTDLLAERLGIRYCFATWSYHANELMGRGGRLTQVGIRATRFDRGHWEQSLGVVQRWADECRREPERVVDEIIAHYKKLGVRGVYFSNDIDGTDENWASATGTPEAKGLEPSFVLSLIRRLGAEVGIVAGDVMEVAPPLGPTPADAERTCRLAAVYLREMIYAALRAPMAP
jgi:agmatinase